MPFTNIETIKQHLSESGAARDSFRDVSLRLTGSSSAALAHSHLKPATVVVKGKELAAPQFEEITLGSTPASLAYSDVIPDSVVAAKNSSLGTIYTENVDYNVDYALGLIGLAGAGTIGAGESVAVWYYHYRIYVEGLDYSVNPVKGTIRRLPAGAIEDGQTVFVDYQIQAGFFEDAQIANAIVEADDRIIRLIAPQYQSSADQTLITVETYLALSILCRMKSMTALDPASGLSSAGFAASWLELAQKYESDGLALLRPFLAARSALSSPAVVKGGLSE